MLIYFLLSSLQSFLSSIPLPHTRSFVHSYVHISQHSSIHSSIHRFIDSFIHSFIPRIVRSFIHACPRSFMHAHIHSISIVVPVRGGGLAPRLPSGMLRSPSLVIAPACCLPHAAGHLIRIHEVLTAGRCRAPGPAAPPRAVSAWGIRHQRCTSSN